MRHLAFLLEYDGSAFAGSQLQRAEVRTVQRELETAWHAFTAEAARVSFAGRTDAGVHATGQVATLATAVTHDPRTCRDALNHYLPADLAIRAVTPVAPGFDPRRHATSRVYRYAIEDGRTRSPLTRTLAWQLRDPLDLAAMTEAARALPLDERDWAAFAGPTPAGYPTIRRLHARDLRRTAPHRLEFTIAASGFLPHQVRRTVGALVRVGQGALTPATFAALIDAPAGSAGPTAPPHGLTLLQVHYPTGAVDWAAGGAADGTEEF
jgi:tRNA pseudouridine38-40 synthase